MQDAGLRIQMWDKNVQLQVQGSLNARRVTNRLKRRGVEVLRVSQLDGTSNVVIAMRADRKLTYETLRALVSDLPGLTIPF